MMTWTNGIVFKYDQNLNLIETLNLPSEMKEGWGMTHYKIDGKYYLLTSDGSNKIYQIDPCDFSVVKTIHVRHNG